MRVNLDRLEDETKGPGSCQRDQLESLILPRLAGQARRRELLYKEPRTTVEY